MATAREDRRSEACALPTLVKQHSVAQCIPNVTFGCLRPSSAWPDGAAWVSAACRADLRCGSRRPLNRSFTCGYWRPGVQESQILQGQSILGCDCVRRRATPAGGATMLAATVNLTGRDVQGSPGLPSHMRTLPAEAQPNAPLPACLIMTTFNMASRIVPYVRNVQAWAAALQGVARLIVVNSGSGDSEPLPLGDMLRGSVLQVAYTQRRCFGEYGNLSGYGHRGRGYDAWRPGQYCHGIGQAVGEAEAVGLALTEASKVASCPLILKVTGKYFVPSLANVLRTVPPSCGLLVQSRRDAHGQNSELFGGVPHIVRRVLATVVRPAGDALGGGAAANNYASYVNMEKALMRAREQPLVGGLQTCVLPPLPLNWSVTGARIAAGSGKTYDFL